MSIAVACNVKQGGALQRVFGVSTITTIMGNDGG